MVKILFGSAAFLTLQLASLTLPAQQAELHVAAITKISEQSVQETVAFLSSDEMAGRDTPSPELEKAAEYVAKRFAAAGLTGGSADQGFFQIAKIATTSLPTDGIEFLVGNTVIEHFGLMGAGQQDFEYQGKITVLESTDSKTQYVGPVSFTADKILKPADQLEIARQVGRLKRRGATAVLIQVEPDSPLIAIAARNGNPRIINPRERFSGPTLLVRKFDADAEYRIRIPKIAYGETGVRNVIGVLHGSDPQLKAQAIVFSAHLDHIGQQSGLPDPIFNGADDNASGVTAVLSLADAFGALPVAPKRTILFMTFWGEERGLLGSKHFVDHPTWPLSKIVANINIEMIGRPEPGANGKCWMTGWHESNLGSLMAASSKSIEVEIFEHPRLSSMLYQASDNASFVNRGVIAHSFSAGSLHNDYHRPGDEWEKLELPHMTKVIQGLFVGSLPMANGEVTPRKE